jgi:hypothetical protein
MATAEEIAGLSDEAYGVAWAAANGGRVQPVKNKDGGTNYFCLSLSPEGGKIIRSAIGRLAFDIESDAYAALGAAVRAVRRQVPGLPGEG